MNRHSAIGADLLGKSRIGLFQLAAKIALAHHERWDGTGCPQGLAGEAIPLSGRIVKVWWISRCLDHGIAYRPPSAMKKPWK